MDEPTQPPPSNPPGVVAPDAPPPQPVTPQAPLAYEETPIIESAGPPQTQPTPQKPVKKRSGSCVKTIGIIILIILLFAGGIWLSSFVRQFLPAGQSPLGGAQPSNLTPTPSVSASASTSAIPNSQWKTYTVVSGTTKTPISGLQFQLPPDVLSPICDGASCVSQGTYLPGGTRFTVAARGVGQSLRDFRGTQITDANGVPIPTKSFSLGGISGTEYESSTSGRTVSGYAFTQMRGVMIPLTDTLSVEVNHFTPSGISADFAADDTLFDSIIKTFTYTASSTGEKGMPPSTATSSGN